MVLKPGRPPPEAEEPRFPESHAITVLQARHWPQRDQAAFWLNICGLLLTDLTVRPFASPCPHGRARESHGSLRVFSWFHMFVWPLSVVRAATDHLLAGGPQHHGVLVLGRVAALDVAERRIGLHDLLVTQVLQRHQVLGLAQSVQPAATERQRPEVLVDDVQKLLRLGQSVRTCTGVFWSVFSVDIQ